jgi:hypothetical protein
MQARHSRPLKHYLAVNATWRCTGTADDTTPNRIDRILQSEIDVRDCASGFCYVNDVVLAALALRDSYARVLCLDVDVHHGDGTERAFLHSNSVFTLSLHHHEVGFFPGTTSLMIF